MNRNLARSLAMLLAAAGAGCARPGAPERPGTVVCVHGFLRTRANLAAAAASLRWDGFRVVQWPYPSRSGSIERHADRLAEALSRIARERPGQPIHFVAHSLGGLIVRAAIHRPGCPPEARIGKAVLIAPPNRGSALARALSGSRIGRAVFGDQAGRELIETPEDGFDALGSFPPAVRVLVIAGDAGFTPGLARPNDGKVSIGETRLPTPHAHETVHATHSWIAWSPRAIGRTRRFLAADAPDGCITTRVLLDP